MEDNAIHAGNASANASTNPVTMIRLFTSSPITGMNHLVRVHLENGNPEAQAEQVAIELADRDPADRAIQLWRPMGDLTDVPINRIIAGKHDLNPIRDFHRRFASALRDRGIAPSMVALDAEYDGIDGYYGSAFMFDNPERITQVFSDPDVQQVLPPGLAGLTPETFGRQHYTPWMEWALPRYCSVLRDVIRGAYAGAFPHDIPVVNYDDMHLDFPVFDLNGWEMVKEHAIGRYSCPHLYLYEMGQRYGEDKRLKRHRYWNSFIDKRNQLIGCLNRGPAIVWIGARSVHSDKAYRFLNDELMQHAIAAGTSAILLFNPDHNPNQKEDAAVAAALIAKHGKRAYAPAIRKAVPLDAAEVKTGSFSTRYSDFAKLL